MSKQVKFKELETNDIHGGILLDNGDLICGCCGGIFEADEKGETWELLKEYDNWASLDDEIIGDDWEAEEDTRLVCPCSCKDCTSYEAANSRRGSCFRYGGFVDGDNVEDCLHGTGGEFICWMNAEKEVKRITSVPVRVNNKDTKPSEILRYLLNQQEDLSDPMESLRQEVADWMTENEIVLCEGLITVFIDINNHPIYLVCETDK